MSSFMMITTVDATLLFKGECDDCCRSACDELFAAWRTVGIGL
ncbi:hypothetical protein Q3V23_36250 [Streptomyces sp. VNUA116]|nr:hypothetical protein [Streptomyces sp. VNUA116]WKU42664.1 hypothetical protein Q3V23_00440 [Streptomyces sp. VNUA116]WKU49081.1 hypothetical protein Q3V23_36250 [Streptomyces sp. VNUA116]